jgi:hypothetical protein
MSDTSEKPRREPRWIAADESSIEAPLKEGAEWLALWALLPALHCW